MIMTDHPAKFTDVIIETIRSLLLVERDARDYDLTVLDPFAGTGKIHLLDSPFLGISTRGVEIEPEWADLHPQTLVGNALALPFRTGSLDVVATSPTYGNRMADHHNAKDDSKRMTYKHRLGRDLHPESSGALHWGPKYFEFHERAWAEVTRVLRPGGLFIINVKNFYRTRTVKGTRVTEEVEVCQWHLDLITRLGYSAEADIAVPVRGMRMGANHKKRVNHEMVYAMRREVQK